MMWKQQRGGMMFYFNSAALHDGGLDEQSVDGLFNGV